jgi:predicted RNA methylase
MPFKDLPKLNPFLSCSVGWKMNSNGTIYIVHKSMEQDTGKFRKNEMDQYYTKKSVAEQCVQKIFDCCNTVDYQWVEPSAGNGVFLSCLPTNCDKVGIDIDPKASEVIKGDFLTWLPTTSKKRIFFGNPPFGRQGSLAKAFIKHSAEFGNIIAFVLPRSFVKPSMSRAFPLLFHCIHSEELGKNAFVVNDKSYDVPCVFQIWEKKEHMRILPEPVKEEGFEYVKFGQPFDIAFKRAGGLAGKCYISTKGSAFNPQYHYYLKLKEEYEPQTQKIVEFVNSHVFPNNTTGPRSLSKSEANEVLNAAIANTTP